MAEYVEQRRPYADAADAQSDGGDAHVLDGGVGEEAFVVVGAAQEKRAHAERENAHDEQYRAHPRENLRSGEQFVDAQQREESGVDHSRGDQRRSRRGGCEIGVYADRVEREQFQFAAVSAENQQEGRLQVERVARRGRFGDGFVRKRFAFGRGGQQQDAQIGHGDARRADEDVFPRRFERLRRAAVVDDARRAERRRFEENPRYGEVVGEIGSGDGRGEQHQQGEIETVGAEVLPLQVGFRVTEDVHRDDDEQQVEERAERVEGEECGRGRVVKPAPEQQARGGDLNGVEEYAGGENRTFGPGEERRDGDQDAGDQVIYHGVSPLRW